jgi:hypothetical protein
LLRRKFRLDSTPAATDVRTTASAPNELERDGKLKKAQDSEKEEDF